MMKVKIMSVTWEVLYSEGRSVEVHSLVVSEHVQSVSPLCMRGTQTNLQYKKNIRI